MTALAEANRYFYNNQISAIANGTFAGLAELTELYGAGLCAERPSCLHGSLAPRAYFRPFSLCNSGHVPSSFVHFSGSSVHACFMGPSRISSLLITYSLCMCERERERKSVCVRERERLCVCVCVCLSVVLI